MKPHSVDLIAFLPFLLLLLEPALAAVDAHIADSSTPSHNDSLPVSRPPARNGPPSSFHIPSSSSSVQIVTETLNKDPPKVTPLKTSLPRGKHTESSNSPYHSTTTPAALASITTSTSTAPFEASKPSKVTPGHKGSGNFSAGGLPLAPTVRTHKHSLNPHKTRFGTPIHGPSLTHTPSTTSAHHNASHGPSSPKIPTGKTVAHNTHHHSNPFHHYQSTASKTQTILSSITNTNSGARSSKSAGLAHSDGLKNLIPPLQSIIPVNITGSHSLTTISSSAPNTIQSQTFSSPGDNHPPFHSTKSTKASSPSTSQSILQPTSHRHMEVAIPPLAAITLQDPASFPTTATTQSASGFISTTHANVTIFATTDAGSPTTSPTRKHINPSTSSTSTVTAPNTGVTDRNLFFWGTQEVHPESVGGIVIGIAIVVYILAYPIVFVLLRRRHYRENPRVDDEVRRESRRWGGQRGFYAAL